MPFISTDHFVSGGPLKLQGDFPATVFKFDTSTFYNWEQDNEPIYDLEDRTDYLWQRLGYTSSSTPGITLTLSSSNENNDPNVFTSVTSLVESIPKVLNQPLLVELASSGNHCDFTLDGIQMENNGGIEIINRMFGGSIGTSAQGAGVVIGDDGRNFASGVSSIDLANSLQNASAVNVSTNVYNATNLQSFNRVFVRREGSRALASIPDRVTFSVNAANLIGAGNRFNITTVYGSGTDSTIPDFDVFPRNKVEDTINDRGTTVDGMDANVLVYGATFSGITVKNCGGPIYLRNICVDGGTAGPTHSRDIGINIENSNVVLDNIAAVRCASAGMQALNSQVTLTKAFVGHRNYYLVGSNRQLPGFGQGAGIRAINSTLTVSDTGDYQTGEQAFFSLDRNDIGLDLDNSVIQGGSKRDSADSDLTHFHVAYNNIAGVRARNSHYNLNGFLNCISNKVGIDAVDSYIELEEGGITHQLEEGIKAKSSTILYNKRATSLLDDGLFFNQNAQHAILDDTYMEPMQVSGMHKASYVMTATSSHGISVSDADQTGPGAPVKPVLLPSFEIKNNSFAELVSLAVGTWDYQETSPDGYEGAIYGAAVAVTDNSKATFRGWFRGSLPSIQRKPTVFVGPPNYTAQNKCCAVYAGRNSIVEFTGPTKMTQWGINVLAEDNSIIRFNPPRKQDGTVNVDQWNLGNTKSHTTVELHSTRAGLVVNRGSILEIKDLGDWETHWEQNVPAGTFTSSVDLPGDATYRDGSHVSGGYMIFYPNPQDADVAVAQPGDAFAQSFFTHFMTTSPVFNGNANQFNLASSGGICVRATQGSKVKVHNANFYIGDQNPSGPYYDGSSAADTCEKLMIWNIADTSELDAAYLSISGMYPSQAGYGGPSSIWASGVNAETSAAPQGTPDTSTLSLLDYFGGSNTVYPSNTKSNFGIFRLYFTPKQPAKFLNLSSTDGVKTHIAYQILAQGYNPSGNLIASGDHDIYGTESELSGFYYASSMLDQSTINRVRLDESAANTFANAKHCAVDKSGTGRVVTIYRGRALTERGSEAYSPPTTDNQPGVGLKSVAVFDLSRDN